MTKNEAKTLKKDQILYYLSINFAILEVKVDTIVEEPDETGVTVVFDDGCMDYFDEKEHPYLFLDKKSAINKAKSEIQKILDQYKDK